ncbi:MAG: trypsin-like peptidase domain-containing protein [Gaiellaceae bacterium]
MRLTPEEYTALEDALNDAFVSYDDLALVARRAGWQIQRVTEPKALPQVVLAVIEYAEARDAVDDLIAAARASNTGNEKLLKVAAAIGLEPGGVPPSQLTPDTALSKVVDHFERMVDPNRGIADLGSFAARLQELLAQVCAVELGDESGTGFLIGPETILTNYHVVEKAITQAFDPANVRVRFDYRRLRDGKTTNAGAEYSLADGWLVHAEPYSAVDKKPYDEASLPAENELDFAVLRTREKIGLQAPSGPAETPRGWVAPRVAPYDFPIDTFLMVVQHPCHDPISFDDVDNAVYRVNPNRTRVHYRTNTMPGSSGSPVLSRTLELVALHHAGEPGSPDFGLPCHKRVTQASYNEGIPIAKIQAQLASNNLSWVFGSEAP